MTLKDNKYQELMSEIHVTDEMADRVLSGVEKAMAEEEGQTAEKKQETAGKDTAVDRKKTGSLFSLKKRKREDPGRGPEDLRLRPVWYSFWAATLAIRSYIQEEIIPLMKALTQKVKTDMPARMNIMMNPWKAVTKTGPARKNLPRQVAPRTAKALKEPIFPTLWQRTSWSIPAG